MKKWWLLLCCLSYGFIMAQDCRQHALMQKGAQLEYKEYWLTASRQIPIARVFLNIDQVTDSAGSTWSIITKKVFSIIDSNDHYERKLVLQCDGRNLHFPFDFYFTDTIYTKDFYSDVSKDKYGYAAVYMPLEDAITYIVPLATDCIVSLPEGKKHIERKIKPGYVNFSLCRPRAYDVERSVKINSIILQGRETIKTPAGNFDCHKFSMELLENGNEPPFQYLLYYNKETGFVQLEDYRHRVELINIRK